MSTHTPERGQRYRHVETGTVAVFLRWHPRAEEWGGPLMVLAHPEHGECRWHPDRARRYVEPPKLKPGPKPQNKHTDTRRILA